ncbi:MAG: hypothetical protein M1829_000759 [Trizodia sp. TS-e1964]|nr:MAG: hypothetical protein M1829_000759 [Trizodia sp. TS-e1964]
MVLNGILTAIWIASFSLLTWATSSTLSHKCNSDNWGNEDGIMICRMYKALFAFAAVGLVSTLSAFILDIVVRRRQTSRGVYIKTKDEKLDDHHTGLYDPVREGPFDATASRTALATAYVGPAEQGKYSDTQYHAGYGR